MYAHVWACVYMLLCVHTEVRGRQGFSSVTLRLIPLKRDLSLNWELMPFSGAGGKQALAILLSPPKTALGLQAGRPHPVFCTSGPQSCASSTPEHWVTHTLSPQTPCAHAMRLDWFFVFIYLFQFKHCMMTSHSKNLALFCYPSPLCIFYFP